MRYISEASEGKEAESYPEFAFSDAVFDQAKVTSREVGSVEGSCG